MHGKLNTLPSACYFLELYKQTLCAVNTLYQSCDRAFQTPHPRPDWPMPTTRIFALRTPTNPTPHTPTHEMSLPSYLAQ
jgi:hypothetical protein